MVNDIRRGVEINVCCFRMCLTICRFQYETNESVEKSKTPYLYTYMNVLK